MTAVMAGWRAAQDLDAMDADMLRRWWKDHGALEQLTEAIKKKLGRGELTAAASSLEHLATALEGHFATEEEIYFPLAEQASPLSAPLLEMARLAHCELRESLQDLFVLIESADPASAQRALTVLLHRLHAHEVEEVVLIVELERLADPARLA
jgi:hypothetical protein